ncbi:hypothetical protein ACFWP0_13105 [Achromobacter sp. NPDC058515]|uniref:hypothetical protein n=1 Tax=Achromobacter sp. NPDC058515 TaxID=3346533 RepID=UPI0036485415
MPPTAIKWLSSIVFGLLVGSATFSVTHPLLLIVFGLHQPAGEPFVPSDPAVMERMQLASVVLYALIAIAVAVALARISNMRRLIGWGCLLLGVALLATIPVNLLLMDPAVYGPSAADARDAKTALFFFMLIFGLPYLGGGLLLTIAGTVLIRKNRDKPAVS